MTDERIDALIRRLDVTSDPDPEFVRSTYASLRPRARAARVRDATWIGRLVRDLRLVVAGSRGPSMARPLGVVSLLVLLILASIVALAIVGTMNRSIRNGPLIVSIHGELQAIDVIDGSVRAILPPGDNAQGVSRSPDGRLVSFWTTGGGQSHLYVVGVDGQHRREIGSDLTLPGPDAIDTVDTWSSDSRFLATEVILGGLGRIVVADVDTGAVRPVTPTGLPAHSPLWSPDDRWIAFVKESGSARSLAMIRTDGSDMRTLSGDLVNVGGPDTWSSDGAWIYFGDSARIYRVNVFGGFTQRLTGDDLDAFAPASSPDGTLIAFIVDRSHQYWDLYAASSDGTSVRRLLDHAEHDGWSADGRYILVTWNPFDRPGGLALMTPDGGEFRVVLPFDEICRSALTCTDGVGWGQARP